MIINTTRNCINKTIKTTKYVYGLGASNKGVVTICIYIAEIIRSNMSKNTIFENG